MLLFKRGKGILVGVWGMIHKYTSPIVWLLPWLTADITPYTLLPAHSKQDLLENQGFEYVDGHNFGSQKRRCQKSWGRGMSTGPGVRKLVVIFLSEPGSLCSNGNPS